MAELGETNDPKALIPGNPDAIEANVHAIKGRGDSMAEAGAGLKGIDTGNYWMGIGADAFRDAFSEEPPRWATAGDAFQSAATALGGYGLTLRWAQGQALEAIALWNEAQASTQRATDAHNASVAQANALNTANAAAGSSTRIEVAPFDDPGEEGRALAKAKLQNARNQLQTAGDRAAEAVKKAGDEAPEEPSRWSKLLGYADEYRKGAWELGFGLGELALQGPTGAANTIAASLVNGVLHPVEFGKQLIDYETWKENPARAAGHLGAGVGIGIATGGAGLAARPGVSIAETAASTAGRQVPRVPLSQLPKTYQRPSHWRAGVRDDTWDNAASADGKVRDPVTGREMNKADPWQMGHKPGHEFWKHANDANVRGITREEFLDEYFNANNYRPELPKSNSSHAGEDVTDIFFGP